jgi:hypothetical protein
LLWNFQNCLKINVNHDFVHPLTSWLITHWQYSISYPLWAHMNSFSNEV